MKFKHINIIVRFIATLKNRVSFLENRKSLESRIKLNLLDYNATNLDIIQQVQHNLKISRIFHNDNRDHQALNRKIEMI